MKKIINIDNNFNPNGTTKKYQTNKIVSNRTVFQNKQNSNNNFLLPFSGTIPNKNPQTKKILKFILLGLFIAILALLTIIGIKAINITDKIFVGQKLSFFGKIKEVIRGVAGNEILAGENLGKINILLLGIGGEGHDGPYLSDTMILAQIRPDQGEIALSSIPRDLLAEMPKNAGLKKINQAFADGFSRNESYKEAGDWAMAATEKITGMTIPYFAVVDFQGFEKAINEIGGIEINIERSFTDNQFPGPNYTYLPPISFTKGQKQMDGKTALIFARSRHGDNNEGNDFARSIRQQKVINAFKQKIFKLNLITDTRAINSLVNTFADHFHTNLNPGEILRLVKLANENQINKFLSSSLDEQTGIICPKVLEENGAWVLVPCQGKSLSDLHAFFKNAFVIGKLREEQAIIWLATSTQNQKAYVQADKKLKDFGLTVWEVGFDAPLEETIIYPLNLKPATLEFIKNEFSATIVSLPPPGIKINPEKADLIVILGKTE